MDSTMDATSQEGGCTLEYCTNIHDGMQKCESIAERYYCIRRRGFGCPRCEIIVEDLDSFMSHHVQHAGPFTCTKKAFAMKILRVDGRFDSGTMML